MSSLAFFMRAYADQFEIQGVVLVGIAVRVLQDLPPMTIAVRKVSDYSILINISKTYNTHHRNCSPYSDSFSLRVQRRTRRLPYRT